MLCPTDLSLTGIGLGGQLQRHRFAVAGNLRKWELVLIFFTPFTFESIRWQQYLGLSLLDVDCYPAKVMVLLQLCSVV
jgi:hypothetical protein